LSRRLPQPLRPAPLAAVPGESRRSESYGVQQEAEYTYPQHEPEAERVAQYAADWRADHDHRR